MDIKQKLFEWGINAVALVAGTVGAIINVTLNDKLTSFRSAFAQMMAGIVCSGYGSTVLVDWLKITSPGATGLTGLFLGLAGMYISRGIMRLGERFAKDPVETIKDIKNLKSQDHVDNN